MTDELDVLLEEEEALEAELAELLAHRTFYYYRKKEETAPEEMTGEHMPEWEAEAEVRTEGLLQPLYRGAAGAEAAVRPEQRFWQHYRSAVGAEPTGEEWEQKPTVASGEGLYEILSRTRQAVRYRRPAASQKIPLVKEPETGGSVNWSPADVDRAFQIDARRYDGGFSWQ